MLDERTELQNKPTGIIDLGKIQKLYEGCMKRGKNRFGKANAALDVVAQNMAYVEVCNKHCVCLKGKLGYRPR